MKQDTEQLKTGLEREVLKLEVISCNLFLLSIMIAGTKHYLLPCQLTIYIFLFILYSPSPCQLYYEQCIHNQLEFGVVIQRQAWPNPQSLPPVGKLDLAKIKCEPDHLTIPNDGTDVWEIDPKHMVTCKFTHTPITLLIFG